MSLTPQDIDHVATLARLDLTSEEKERYAGELTAIFEYIDILREVDTERVEETCQVTGLEDVFREDTVVQCRDEVKERLLAAFPKRMGRLLEVDAVFGDD